MPLHPAFGARRRRRRRAGAADTALGTDPATGQPITVKKGPYGHYIQLGRGRGTAKPKRVALPAMPEAGRRRSRHGAAAAGAAARDRTASGDGEPIIAGIGRFGAYIKHGQQFASLAADDDVLTIG